MSLKDEGMRIDAELQEQCSAWITEIRNAEAELEKLEDIIKAAAAFGDLSENNEYQTAISMKQNLLRRKLGLEEKVQSYRSKFESYATKEVSRGDIVTIGSVVRVHYVELNKDVIVKITPPKSDAPQKYALSSMCPLGRALLNKKQGDMTTVLTERNRWSCRVEEVY